MHWNLKQNPQGTHFRYSFRCRRIRWRSGLFSTGPQTCGCFSVKPVGLVLRHLERQRSCRAKDPTDHEPWIRSPRPSTSARCNPISIFGFRNSTRLKIWNVETGKLLASLLHEAQPTCVAWSEDGSILASSVSIGTEAKGQGEGQQMSTIVRVWNPASEQELQRWSITQGRIDGLCVDKRGEVVAAAIGELQSDNTTLRPSKIVVWDAQSGRIKHQLTGGQGFIPVMCFRQTHFN